MQPRTSTQTVLEAVQELFAKEVIITREVVAQYTGMKLSVVDDRLKTLVTDELLIRLGRGIYRPAHIHPPSRQVAVTVVPGGPIKIEVGDGLLTVSKQEVVTLACIYAGSSASWESGHEADGLSRVISKSQSGDGTVVLEVGDQALTLTPREDRTLAGLLCGSMNQAAAIELGARTARIAGEFSQRLRSMERELLRLASISEHMNPVEEGQLLLDIAGCAE